MARKIFRRRPNGSSSVVKLSGNRRKPYGARVFNGYNTVTSMPQQKFIGYFETWEEANNALTLYNLQANKEISTSEIKDISPKVYLSQPLLLTVIFQKKNRYCGFSHPVFIISNVRFKSLRICSLSSGLRINFITDAFVTLNSKDCKRITSSSLG